MDYVMVTLRYQQQEADVELPTSVPLFKLLPIVTAQLSWPAAQKSDKLVGRIGGLVLRPHETLAQMEVLHGTVMELVPVNADLLIESGDDQINLNYVSTAYLKSRDTGESIPIQSRSNLIGRAPGCAINLRHLPNSDVISGQHANVVQRNDGYWLTDENSTNGTVVDGVHLRAGESVRLRHGSQIQFGETGPIFTFYTPANN